MTTNPLSQVPRELAERLCEEGWLNTGGDSACDDIELAAGEKAATDKVEAVIREAMQKAQPQWISVEVKLPKVDEKVLAYAPKYAETPEESVITTWFEVDGWMVENDCGADVVVTHWMPLPEPPNPAASSLTEQETTK
jgi:hypothetical protein